MKRIQRTLSTSGSLTYCQANPTSTLHLMFRPSVLFILLVILSYVVGSQLQSVYLQKTKASTTARRDPAPAETSPGSMPESGPVPLPGMATGAGPNGRENSENLQVNILQSQIEYLEQQNQLLQEENSKLIDQLASLRGKQNGASTPTAPMDMNSAIPSGCDPNPSKSGVTPDFVGIGIELVRLRELQDIPIPTIEVPKAEVEKRISQWLSTQFAPDHGRKQGRALAALGAIPRPVDTIALKAAFWTYQIGGWYDSKDATIYLAKEVTAPHLAKENAMALSYSYLFKHKASLLFPPNKEAITLDARLSRDAIMAGDAAHLRFLHAIQNPSRGGGGGVGEDPDDPSRLVPIPNFLRELELLPFSIGLDFMQAMHSIGGWEQVDATYTRPPVATPELMDSQVYLQETPYTTLPIEWSDIKVQDATPFWNDTLGPLGTVLLLKQYIPEPVASECISGWINDRLMTYENKQQGRDHVVWQTLWRDSDAADGFFSAMRSYLTNRHKTAAPSKDAGAGIFELKHQDRILRLKRTHQGTGVLFLDAANPAFAEDAGKKFGNS